MRCCIKEYGVALQILI